LSASPTLPDSLFSAVNFSHERAGERLNRATTAGRIRYKQRSVNRHSLVVPTFRSASLYSGRKPERTQTGLVFGNYGVQLDHTNLPVCQGITAP
jgi:hypothetical protein